MFVTQIRKNHSIIEIEKDGDIFSIQIATRNRSSNCFVGIDAPQSFKITKVEHKRKSEEVNSEL